MKNEAKVNDRKNFGAMMRLLNDQWEIENAPTQGRKMSLMESIVLAYRRGWFLIDAVKREYEKNKDKSNCNDEMIRLYKFILDLDACLKGTRKAT